MTAANGPHTPPDPAPRWRSGDQIPPRIDAGRTGPSVQDALIRRIQERRELGRQRYGTDLRTFNGRDAVRDAAEEALDLASYLTQVEMEMQELSADGGNGTLIDLLSRAGMDTSRDNIIRVSQMVERFQRWALAQVTAKTNWLARKLADANDANRTLQYEFDRFKETCDGHQEERTAEFARFDRVFETLLSAWTPCTPEWREAHGGHKGCARTSKAVLPQRPGHYHPVFADEGEQPDGLK